MVGARPDLGMVAAHGRPFFVNGAASGLLLEIGTIAIRPSCQRKFARFRIVMVDNVGAFQLFGNGAFVCACFYLKWIDQLHPY